MRSQSPSYDPSQPLIGATGEAHLSAAEAEVSYQLLPLGIVPDASYFPVTFTDAEGQAFTARSDFSHEATGFYFEYKPGSVNGIKTKASADRQRADLESAVRQGFVRPEHYLYKLNQVAWSNSIKKQGIVQQALGANHFALLLAEEPDPETTDGRRVIRSGIFYRTEANIGVFAFFLKLAAMGLDVGFSGPGHSFGVRAEG
jgi:hypothetical protein